MLNQVNRKMLFNKDRVVWLFQSIRLRDIRPIHLFRPDGTPRKSLGEIEDALSKYVSFFTHRFIRKTFRRKNKKSLRSI